MTINMTVAEIYAGIISDFEGAWLALSRTDLRDAPGRGNFMFMRQAMVLLEFVSRLTSPGGVVTPEHDAFASALRALEPRYFSLLPGRCGDDPKDFLLPLYGPEPERQLLTAIFDLTRNGGAHQYQQITVTLADDRVFGISIPNGPMPDVRPLGDPRRQSVHLVYQKQPDAVWLAVSPDTIFLDIKESAESVGIARLAALPFHFLERGKMRPKSNSWRFSEGNLLSAFDAAGLESIAHRSSVRKGWTDSEQP